MTEEARISELLKPRYKVIADYPGNIYHEGQILVERNKYLEKFVASGHDVNLQYIQRPANYPSVFKKMQWWQERKPEEMPEYVWYDTSSIYEKESLIVLKVAQWLQEPDGEIWASVEGDKIGYSSFFMTKPATKSQYDQYIKTKQK